MTTDRPALTIVIINGSVRPGNYTSMASALVADELRKDPGVHVEVIDPVPAELAQPGTAGTEAAARLAGAIASAAGVVLATPEYHGSFSSVMKLALENMGFPSALKGKPVALLGVAAGRIGAIKSLEHLRSVCAHVGAYPLPMLVSVANVQQVFAPDGRCLDEPTERFIRSTGSSLMNYLQRHVCPAFELERVLRDGIV